MGYVYSEEEVAQVIHAANAVMQGLLGHSVISLPWFSEPEEQRRVTAGGVHKVRRWLLSARQNHEQWLAVKWQQGWSYGPEKDLEAKTHPCMVAWEQLPPENKDQAELFVAIVLALSRKKVKVSEAR